MTLLRTRGGRRLLLGALYLSEGAPMGWLWWALPTRLRAAGVPLEDVTALTSLLVLPWALKFLWAPAVDALRGPRWGLRAWVVAAQAGMVLCLLPLLGGDLTELSVLTPVLLAHAFCAATQDVAVDALALGALPADERGSANGWMQAGMLLGRGLFGGLSLRAESWIGTDGVVVALIVCCSFSGVLLLFAGPAPDERAGTARPSARLAALGRALRELVRSPVVGAGMAFAFLGGAAFEAVTGTAHSLLLDLGLPQESVAVFYALPVIVAMATGALAGGWWADRAPRVTAARRAVLGVAACVTALAAAVAAGLDVQAVVVLLTLVYVALGLLTAASYALFMDLCDPRAAATQFSAFMGVTNMCEAWAVRAAGSLASLPEDGPTPGSYAATWMVLTGASLLSLPFLRRARLGGAG